MEELLSCDTYEVYGKSNLSYDQIRSLTMLYQPLIGANAISVYLSLYSELDMIKLTSLSSTHARLTMITSLSLSEIKRCIGLLEGIGLMKTYIQESHDCSHYLYQMMLPLDSKRFFQNNLLHTLLYKSLGSLDYEKNKFYFSLNETKLDSYKEITAKFDDIFYIEDTCEEGKNILKEKSTFKQVVSMDPVIQYPMDLFYQEIQKLQVRRNIISVQLENTIKQLGVVYHIGAHPMAQLVFESIENHQINENTLIMKARAYHELEAPRKFELVHQTQPRQYSFSKDGKDAKSKHIQQLESWSPYKLIEKKQGSTPTRHDLTIVENLMLEQGLEAGVINVLLELTWAQNDNRMSRSYMEAVAATWKRKGIKSVQEAMQEAKNTLKAKSKSANDSMPQWYQEQVVDNQLNVDNEEGSNHHTISEDKLREIMGNF